MQRNTPKTDCEQTGADNGTEKTDMGRREIVIINLIELKNSATTRGLTLKLETKTL